MAEKEVIAVCDGSFYKEHSAGGAGWFLESIDQSATASGSCLTPGPANMQSSPCIELMGVLCMVLHSNYI